ncbi:hypothetical protein [Pseudomarimonas arenosa]|uniref:Tetratricopeptide repeat protein n=1 Tax=Pseudomarimonas arenosa TaxID=2774145 RepID=A0AAW3ZN78_9GAMM|nr:hypothetical protein [Pseudomarimonas arenosa]MBD8526087.1 hypothetical protein [Pseudomarimonas arenosa]
MSNAASSGTPSSVWRQVRQRHLIPVLTGWFGLCWALIEFSSFLVQRYALPEYLIDMVFAGMWVLLPTVVLLTWWIGEVGAMHWTRSRALSIGVLLLAGLATAWQAPRFIGGPTQHKASLANAVDGSETAAKSSSTAVVVPRVVLFPFKVQGAAEDQWLGAAMAVLTRYDLLFDPRLDASYASAGLLSTLRAQGGRNFDGASRAMLRNAALAQAYQVMVSGEVSVGASGLTVRASVQGLNPDRDLGAIEFEAQDVWSAVDQLAALLREQVSSTDRDQPGRDAPLLSITTDSLPALRAYVEALVVEVQDNDYPRAAELLDQAIALDGNFVAADVQRFLVRAQLGDILQARQIAQALAPRTGMLPDRLRFTMQAIQASAVGREQVLGVYRLWSKRAPHDREPQLMLARMELSDAPDDPAIWQRLQQLAIESGSASELLSLASSALLRELPDQARELATLAAQRNPMEIGAPLLMAEIARLEGRHDEALRALDEAALLRPELISPVLSRADVLFSTGRWEEALRVIENARQRTEHNPTARINVLRKQIDLLRSLGRQQAAFDVLMDLMEMERSRSAPVMMAHNLNGYIGVYASVKGVQAAREWMAQWNISEDPRLREHALANLDLVLGLQLLDRSLYFQGLEKLELAWQQSGAPLSVSALIYQRLGQAWQAGTPESLAAWAETLEEFQYVLAASNQPMSQLQSWHAMLVEIALQHGQHAFARPWLEKLQRAEPEGPTVLWWSLRAALLAGDQAAATGYGKQLQAAWKDADPGFDRLAEFRALTASLPL